MRRLVRTLGLAAVVLAATVALMVLVYRFVPATVTPLMLIRKAEGEGLTRRWAAWSEIAPPLRRAVVASEDARFCLHHGFDWGAIQEAWDNYQSGERLRGGSTITQQTAKNLFLWPGQSWLRKGLEIYPTALLELFWPKRRILETYLNIVEWGHGIYGAEAAAEAYFRKPARSLTPREAALLAAVLPNPRRWSPARPSSYIEHRAAVILARMAATPNGCF